MTMTKTKTLSVALPLVLLVSVIAPAAQRRVDSGLQKRDDEFVAAARARSAARIAALYAEDAVLMPPNETMVKGRKSIEGWMQKQFDAGFADISLSTLESITTGDVGYAVGTYTVSYKPASGDPINDQGKYIEVWKRDRGQWTMAYDIFNSDLPPPR